MERERDEDEKGNVILTLSIGFLNEYPECKLPSELRSTKGGWETPISHTFY